MIIITSSNYQALFKKILDTNASTCMVSTPIHPSLPVNFKLYFGLVILTS